MTTCRILKVDEGNGVASVARAPLMLHRLDFSQVLLVVLNEGGDPCHLPGERNIPKCIERDSCPHPRLDRRSIYFIDRGCDEKTVTGDDIDDRWGRNTGR